MRYFFNIRDRSGLIRDEEGTELADLPAALMEARFSARDFLVDDLRVGVAINRRQIEIADESGDTLVVMPVLEAVV